MNKHIIKAICCALALGGSLASCSNQEKDLFEESSANRLQNALAEYNELLITAPNGWVMEYFSGIEEAGVTYIMKFDETGAVTIAANNKWMGGKYRAERSAYKFIADNGPVLSLSSFNTVFHVMADPIDVPGTSDNELGYGHKGDYEFIVMSASADRVVLKGKKFGQRIYMTALAADKDWEEYLADLDKFSSSMFSSRFDQLTLSADGEVFGYVSNMANGVMNIVRKGDDALTETESAKFIINGTGIRFASPYKVRGGAFSLDELTFTDGMLRGTTPEGVAVGISAGPLADIAMESSRTWKIRTDSIGGRFAEAMEAIANQTKSVHKRNFNGLDITTTTSLAEPCRALSYRMSGSSAATLIYGSSEIRLADNSIRYNFSTTEGNLNGVRRLGDLPGLVQFIELLNATDFDMETNNAMAPSMIVLKSRNDSNDYIVIRL